MELDQIGIWSEIKLEIIRDYASAYTRIMSNQNWCKGYVYIDAFAGAGTHISKTTGKLIPGSPLNALEVVPPFTEYHYVDLDKKKVKALEKIGNENPNVQIYHGDCNKILQDRLFPALPFNSFKRALCILDPYGLHLNWETIKMAAELETVDIFINFPIMDINRNVLFEDLSKAKNEDIVRMNAFWGDESWKGLLYEERQDLFGNIDQIKVENFKTLAKEFSKRLKKVAHFKYIPEPVLMRNAQNGPLYYLYFASQKDVANNIVNDIFNKYRRTL